MLNNSGTIISLSETELTELIEALTREDKYEAKKLLAAAMDEDGLNEYMTLVQAQGIVLAADNAEYLKKCNSVFSGGIAAGISGMFSIFSGGN
jgi:hypothetical protein